MQYCRKRGDRIEVRLLARGFFDSLNRAEPPLPEYRVDQTKQALTAFVRGIENWHWEEDPARGWGPHFRIKAQIDWRGPVGGGIGGSGSGPTHGDGDVGRKDPTHGDGDVGRKDPTHGDGDVGRKGPTHGGEKREVTRGDWERVLRTALRVRHYALRTEQTYFQWSRQFLEFHAEVALGDLTAAHVQVFLEYLAVGRNVAASTQNQALSALLFFFEKVLGRELGKLNETLRAKRGRKLPVVLSREEVRGLLNATGGTTGLMLRLMYGAGLRLMECVRLRVKDVDLARELISVRAGKGDKDRSVPIPRVLGGELEAHRERLQFLQVADRRDGLPGVYLPDALGVKYPRAGEEFAWQWFFPTKGLMNDPRSGLRRRHHLHKNTLGAPVKAAARMAGIDKQVSCHTLRHSYATHLVEDGVDIRSIQELLGHKSVETTMIYTHVATPASRRVHSPLDR